MAEPPASPSDDSGADSLPIGGALRALGVVGPPLTIATALLFYFGWALSAEQARAMGVDESIFVMSTRDYVLRSLSALFVPLIVGSGVLLVWVVLHGLLLDRLHDPRHQGAVRRLGQVLAWSAWWAFSAVGLLMAALIPRWGELALPLSLAVGFLLTEYGLRLRDLADGASGRSRLRRPGWLGNLRGVLIGVLVTAALFWEVANFAEVVGRGKAERVVASSNDYPMVVVYSQRDLRIEAPGVSAQTLPGVESDYRFRYSGLHLLQRTGEKFFLVPSDWAPTQSPLIVLPDEGSIRFEFTGSVEN